MYHWPDFFALIFLVVLILVATWSILCFLIAALAWVFQSRPFHYGFWEIMLGLLTLPLEG